MRRVLSSVAVLAVVAVTTWAAPAASAASYSSYVALGDSYSSASGVLPQVDLLCTRSSRNFPSLVAKSIAPGSFTDVSCGGATTRAMTASQLFTDKPPQFDALKQDTKLVTVGIGGNDVPFAEVVVACSVRGAVIPHGSPCKDSYQSGGVDTLAAKVRAIGPKVGAVLAGIRKRSPNAKVVLVGYPSLLPESGANCWPLVPIADGDAPYLRDTLKLVNQVLIEQAAAHQVTYVDTYTSSIGHDMCQAPGTKWIEGFVLTDFAMPVHPNALGAKNQARQVLAALAGSAR